MNHNKLVAAFVVSLAAAGAAMAADNTDSRGVTTSTDPARIAQIERHAEELKAQQSDNSRSAMHAHSSGTSSAKAATRSGGKHKHHKQRHNGGAQKGAASKTQG